MVSYIFTLISISCEFNLFSFEYSRYTATKGFEGPVFGSSDKWNGLGVFFDSFDNDNKHNNPYIMG